MSEDLVHITIDGEPIDVPKGTLVIRAAEQLGIHIPRFCDHPLLEPVAACRQCLVEVAAPDRSGEVRPMPKPQPACSQTVIPGMEVKTQRTSEVADKAQRGVMEFLLINHPLDCPICDKGGECPLQNQAMTEGRAKSRFRDKKRTFPKPVALSSQILLDRERCILCQRCVRFSKEIAGDAFIDLQGRGGGSYPGEPGHAFLGENIGTYDPCLLGVVDPDANPDGHSMVFDPSFTSSIGGEGYVSKGNPKLRIADDFDVSGRVFSSYFAGNTIQICPVGALTSASYRFRGRPFDLVSTRGVTEHDASGAALRSDVRRGEIVRRMAQRDMDVNEEWLSDKDRFAYEYQGNDNRVFNPQVREGDELVNTSFSDAFSQVAKAITKAKEKGGIGIITGGHLTFEDSYAWSKFARVVARTNNIDMRVRASCDEEEAFLGTYIAGTGMPVTYTDVEKAGRVLLVALEPEDECPTLFLRLRKGVRAGSVKVTTIAPYTSRSSLKMSADVIVAAPGTEPEIVDSIRSGNEHFGNLADELAQEGTVILVGERAARVKGLYSALNNLVATSGASIAWVPRRCGERGGLEAGVMPSMLPFGRPVDNADARVDVGAVWGHDVPSTPGVNAKEMIEVARRGELSMLMLAGVDIRDFDNYRDVIEALEAVDTVVSFECSQSVVHHYADVVIPVASYSEKPGTYINWEGRLRPFGQALASHTMPDREALHRLAAELDIDLGLPTLASVHSEANELMNWNGQRSTFTACAPSPLAAPRVGSAVLATHKPLIDEGVLMAGAKKLAGTARQSVIRLGLSTAQAIGVTSGDSVTVSNGKNSLTLPLVISDLPDRVVWLPELSRDCHVHETLGVGHGSVVSLAPATEVTK
ncbi:MAG: NADH-quinone oxidoreductase subunit G [Actinomycetaceae bacterium]|nr:NADH-quinone oxidoreductase subunit G [Actinomycetaceae bacterium]